jgi:hypothetical protein
MEDTSDGRLLYRYGWQQGFIGRLQFSRKIHPPPLFLGLSPHPSVLACVHHRSETVMQRQSDHAAVSIHSSPASRFFQFLLLLIPKVVVSIPVKISFSV